MNNSNLKFSLLINSIGNVNNENIPEEAWLAQTLGKERAEFAQQGM